MLRAHVAPVSCRHSAEPWLHSRPLPPPSSPSTEVECAATKRNMRVFGSLAVLCGLARLACAVTVYLHPPPSAVPAQLVANRANLAISRHLGLERFDKYGDVDESWDSELLFDQEGVVGTAVRDGLLITMNEVDAKGMYRHSEMLCSGSLHACYLKISFRTT